MLEARKIKINSMLETDEILAKVKEGEAKLELEKAAWEKEKQEIGATHKFDETRIKLDVGGRSFTTTLETLTAYPDSKLGKMFSGRHALHNADGGYFIDRDSKHFRHILNFCRDKDYEIDLSEAHLKELKAEYFGLFDVMFPPFVPAEREVTSSRTSDPERPNLATVLTQDDGGIWKVSIEKQRMENRGYYYWKIQGPIQICEACKTGFLDSFRCENFTTSRKIFPGQPKGRCRTCTIIVQTCHQKFQNG